MTLPLHVEPGTRYGAWTILGPAQKRHNRAVYCRCDCGREHEVTLASLLNGVSTRCLYCKGYRDNVGDLTNRKWGSILSKAKDRNLEVKMTMHDAWDLYLKQEKKCALTGMPLQMDPKNRRGSKGDTASLDRIDSTQGYIPGNVQWVHMDVNMMKNKYPQDYFIDICRKVVHLQDGHHSRTPV